MSHTINAVIIEDNEGASAHLKSLIFDNFHQINILGTSRSVKEAVFLIESKKPDLLFLDIELTDGEGFEVLHQTQHLNYEVIFTTAYNNYLQKAIEHYAFYYLLKPIHLESLRLVIDRLIKIKSPSKDNFTAFYDFIKKQDSILMINTGDEYRSIFIKDIIKCESKGNFTRFTLRNGSKYLASNSLKYYEELLKEKGFFRVNRFHMINLQHVVSIKNKEEIILSNKDHVTVSIRNRGKLKDLLQRLS